MPVAFALFLAFLAMLIELAVGYPQALLRAIGHPVTWMGWLIETLDRSLNRETDTPQHRRGAGVFAVLIVCAVVGAIALILQSALFRLPFGALFVALVASTLLAQCSLRQHVADVALALEQDGIEAGRRAVARIVGRDTGALDEAGGSTRPVLRAPPSKVLPRISLMAWSRRCCG
jgi:adenosylcobinamide-phosphate synthase